MSKQKDKDEQDQLWGDPFDGEYIGNIWGWRFSIISLIIILLMGLLFLYRHYKYGNVDLNQMVPQQQEAPLKDSNQTAPPQ